MRFRALLAVTIAGLVLLVAPVQAASASTASTATKSAPVIVLGCYANVSKAQPKQHTLQTISITQMGAGVTVTVAIHYRTLTIRKITTGSAAGKASVTFDVGRSTRGYRVPVVVSAQKGNIGWSCRTSFVAR